MSLSPSTRKQLLEQVSTFPECPGVYIMKNAAGEPIYIGKAVNLKSRVRSYFSDTHETRAQIPVMLERLASIDWIATATEAEALILEANLIRQHKPHYNIDLRDDKHFPYIKVTVEETYPRLLVVRKAEHDGARYFGPYTDAAAMRRLVRLSKKIFRLCDSAKPLPVPSGAKKTRPCINYAMHRCSGACAGMIAPQAYRVQIDSLCCFLSGKRSDLLADLSARMEKASASLRFEEAALIRDQIRLIRGASRFRRVDRGVPDVNYGAAGSAEDPVGSLESLQQVLHLPKLPETIEAFDISNLGGSFCVAGMVRFNNGAPDRKGYRRYKIKTVSGQNDFAMILEAVVRRLSRLQKENTPFPDLLLIDGGRGQLHAAMKALMRFENPPPVVALAKKEETLHSPLIAEPVVLPAAHPARRLAERVRDEAHRFAVHYHRNIRGKQFSRSAIENLPGIGPAKAKLLIKTFGSLERLTRAAAEDIAKVKGFSCEKALKLKEVLTG